MNDFKNVKKCPQCGGRNIQIEDYDDEYIYIYCEDCDETIDVPVRSKSKAKHADRSDDIDEENNDID
jgi:hypothetical protein